jgi:hypothetical protein
LSSIFLKKLFFSKPLTYYRKHGIIKKKRGEELLRIKFTEKCGISGLSISHEKILVYIIFRMRRNKT